MNKRQKQIDYAAIGKRVFDLRSSRGYSQMELAELIGVERRQSYHSRPSRLGFQTYHNENI